ncbi:hypothetical protein RJ639_042908 [Escallonia herrerae]|uniref:Uncharacterized protein n=1 Tax=Escallonia herrerae TaxID=1293975 RepID=A0AA88WBN6_9ASTE|nr:hypothetical protein RJ639_042908 [Escallonia herrerae]
MQLFQPLFEMENGQMVSASGIGASLMDPFDQGEQGASPHEIMARRLKNRERQRRYRARKRLEADTKNASVRNQFTTLQVEKPVKAISSSSVLSCTYQKNEIVTRIYCRRDWKKDARRAHASKGKEVKSSSYVNLDSTLASGSQAPSLLPGVHAESPLPSEIHSRNLSISGNSEAHRSTLSRRHWKAEARNKKT